MTLLSQVLPRAAQFVRRQGKLLVVLAAFAVGVPVLAVARIWWLERALAPVTDQHRQGRLTARPGRPTMPPPGAGLVPLELASHRDAVLYVPSTLPRVGTVGLVLYFHGYKGEAARSSQHLLPFAERAGVLLLTPSSRRKTWDALGDESFGRDVAGIDSALAHVFARFAVDPRRIVIAGNSDGGSYALSLGLRNGDLFRAVVGFAAGMVVPGLRVGRPSIRIVHGRNDRVHAVNETARPIAADLKKQGYDVTYDEVDAGHRVSDASFFSALAAVIGTP